MKKIIIGLFMFLFSMIFVNANEYETYPYYIKDYNINVDVTDNMKAKVTEYITVVFNSENKGILKYIPYDSFIYREDGSKYKYNLELVDIETNYDEKVSVKDGEYVLKIGTDDLKKGEVDFILRYTLLLNSDSKTEFNYNLIEPRWSSYIENVSFNVNLPTNFDKNSVYITVGTMYSKDTKSVKYTTNGLKISGTVDKVLNPYEGVSLRTYLDDSSFIERNKYENYNFIFVILLVINVVIVWFIWERNGRDLEKEQTNEYKPIEGYNPLELAYIANECSYVSDKMVFSLIIYLANLGYIKIERNFNKLKLIKLKDYKGNNEVERLLMRRLFAYSDEINITKENKLYNDIIRKIKKLMGSPENNIIMDKQSNLVKILPVILGIINIIITGYLVLYGRDLGLILFTLLFTSIGFGLLSYSATLDRDNKQIVLLTISLILIFISGFNTMFDIITNDIALMIYYIFGVLTYCVIMLFIFIMPKRSVKGNLLYSRANNFKDFLDEPNELILSALVKEDKKYLYEVISYAYAFDCEGSLIDAYSNLELKIKAPKWYEDVTDK